MLGLRALIRYAAVAMVMDLAMATDDDEPRMSIMPIKVTKTSQVAPSPIFVTLGPISSTTATTTRRPLLSGWNSTITTAITPSGIKPSGMSSAGVDADDFSWEFPATTDRVVCPPSPVYTITATSTYNVQVPVVPWIYQQEDGTNVTSFNTEAPATTPSAVVVCDDDTPCTTPERQFWCLAATPILRPISALYLVSSVWTEPARFVPTASMGGAQLPGVTAAPGNLGRPVPEPQRPPPATFAPQTTAPPASPPAQVTNPSVGAPQSPPQVISDSPIGPISANPSGPGVILPIQAGAPQAGSPQAGSPQAGSPQAGFPQAGASPVILRPGAATTINNIPISLDAQGKNLQIGTQTFAAPQAANNAPNPTAGPVVPIAVLPSNAGVLLSNGKTLAPGSSTVLADGSTISLPAQGSPQATAGVIITSPPNNNKNINPNSNDPEIQVQAQQEQGQQQTRTIPLSALPTSSPITLPNGITLLPGIPTTIAGVPVSLSPDGSAVVVAGSTIPLSSFASATAAAGAAATASASPNGIAGSANDILGSAVLSGISSVAATASTARVSATAVSAQQQEQDVETTTATAAQSDYSMQFRSKTKTAGVPEASGAGNADGQDGQDGNTSGAASASRWSSGAFRVGVGAVVAFAVGL
ncbi:unnamed protein product [Periconia digitata]|uniref:Uncharacterized protein n=1 Tax=Periconia digitata TaxID=1303443 RepID=A0A9W4XPC9_9PLEO|nr:unnamed protein product [Periconia digitata]